MSVRQNSRYRWLEIANTIQTVMDLSKPYNPVLPHMHGMLLSLYYASEPKSILELGLGGGSLQRFFTHHFTECNIQSVEIDHKIIEYFNAFFANGVPNPLQKVTQEDAQEAIKQFHDIDMLFVDLFSGNAPPSFINDKTFYENCFNALSKDGIIVINLLPVAEIQTFDVEDLLTEIGGYPPAILSIPKYKNRILISAKHALPRIDFDDRLQRMCSQYHIDVMNVVQLK